jgi:cell division protein ZapA
MGQVAVTIDGKSYRMACDDGQEDHLTGLAALFDARVQDMRKSFGEIGDMRLAVMAAITMADEVTELKRKLAEGEVALAAARNTAAGAEAAAESRSTETAAAVTALAERIDRIARSLAS